MFLLPNLQVDITRANSAFCLNYNYYYQYTVNRSDDEGRIHLILLLHSTHPTQTASHFKSPSPYRRQLNGLSMTTINSKHVNGLVHYLIDDNKMDPSLAQVRW